MTAPRRPRKPTRRTVATTAAAPVPVEFWRVVPEPPELEATTPTGESSAVLRSLGTPPLPGHANVADHYVAAVIERAARLATAVAAVAGLKTDAD